MWDQKVYNWTYIDVDLGLDYDPNTLNYDIAPTVTISKFKNYDER